MSTPLWTRTEGRDWKDVSPLLDFVLQDLIERPLTAAMLPGGKAFSGGFGETPAVVNDMLRVARRLEDTVAARAPQDTATTAAHLLRMVLVVSNLYSDNVSFKLEA